MRRLNRALRRELAALESEVQRLATERDAALRRLGAARIATPQHVQREFWLEFAWISQLYRSAIRDLVSFCERVNKKEGRAMRDRTSYERMTTGHDGKS